MLARGKATDVVAMVDLRNIGSSGGLYGDSSVPLAERSTRLLIDVLGAIHDTLLEFFVDHSEALDLSQAGPVLDELGDAITDVRVVGPVEHHTEAAAAQSDENAFEAGLGFNDISPSIGANFQHRQSESSSFRRAVRRSGNERLYVNFGRTGAAFRRISERLGEHRLWVILDEWSSVPLALQPYLADLLRRALFASPNTTVKIGAIEQRSLFKEYRDEGDYLGVELGADASADIDLDDFMVFDNDAERAKDFFQKLIAKHVQVVATQDPPLSIPRSEHEIIRTAFTERRAIEEFVRSCEGVPRDTIHILGLAAQRALENPISVQHIRVAAKNWYERDKEKAASASDDAQRLLHWIIDEVIGGRRARAFLLPTATRDNLIDTL